MPQRVIKKIRRHLDPRSHLFFSSTNWFLMAFVSGAVNSGGYLACHRFVTHVTGFATLFGIEGANGEWDQALGVLSVPIFFLFGAMISAYFIDRPFLIEKKPRYHVVNGFIALALYIAALGGYLNFFGIFGDTVNLSRDYMLLCLLVLAAGMQNSAATSASSGTVRTTHLTGVTTDLGIGIIRTAAMKSYKNENYSREMLLLKARFGIVLSFIIGSIIGVSLFMRYQYLGFLLPASLVTLEVLVNIKYRHLFESRHAWLRLEPFDEKKST